jgi:hypothetical protein
VSPQKALPVAGIRSRSFSTGAGTLLPNLIFFQTNERTDFGAALLGGGSKGEMSDHIRDTPSRTMVLKVRLILGVVILAVFGTLCCQKVWVVPFMTRRLPFSSLIEIG